MPRRPNNSKQSRALLSAFYDAPERWWHGYDLCAKTGLKSGTLYPILMRLKKQGLLVSEWQAPREPGRPPRHIYQLSASGRALAQAQHAEALEAASNLKGKPA